MYEDLRQPGKEGLAFEELPNDVQILMRNCPLDLNELNLDAVCATAKHFYPYLWTYATCSQIWKDLMLMADAYCQGMIDGKRIERARKKRSVKHEYAKG